MLYLSLAYFFICCISSLQCLNYFIYLPIYLSLKSCPSVCLSITSITCLGLLRSKYHLPNHKPIILLLQVCYCELMWYVLQRVEDKEVEKSWATFHRKPQLYSSTGNATDLHLGGRGFESNWWTDFFSKIILFGYTFLNLSFDNTVTWHSKHALKWDWLERK